MSAPPALAAAWRTAVTAGVVGVLGIGALVAALDTGLPFSPMRPLNVPSSAARHLAPQGWAFFTRDPLEPLMFVYRRTDSGWIDASVGANGEPEHLFGWRRTPRAQGVETGLLLFEYGKERFTPCTTALDECLESAPIEAQIHNDSDVPTLCGRISMVRQKRIPWAWRRSAKPENAPTEVMNLEVTC